MEFQLFGEVQLRAGGHLLDVGTPRQQAVLAALLLDAGRPVAIETLIDRVWDEAPAEARNVLYSHLSRIRQLLKRAGDTAKLDRRPAGYVLDVEPDSVDMHRFWRLVDQGHSDEEKSAALTEALSLWRGTPLAGIPGEWVEHVRDRWLRRRLDALVRWGDVELRLGRPTKVLDVFPDFVADYPLAEQLEVVLMRALHDAGRDAEALDRYTAIRERLADELGADPGPELRELHSAILRGEMPRPEQRSHKPAQLPPDVYGFAGRDEEMENLSELAGARIVVVSGTAGVGKTSLVVHWAHRVRDQFPDGQLYLNLRGFDPTGSPVTPADALRGFLDAFDVSHERIPASFEAQVGLYRSLLADRRVLVVLDNARDAEQVRSLLPGAPRCLVLVTSRDQLTGLVAEGAHPLMLDLFGATEARVLLASRIGAQRVAAEPEAVTEIIRLCARLPLALAVVAARAATHPKFSLAALTDELGTGLDELSGTDPATDPRAVFSWSYLQLSDPAARLFRLLALHPGPDIGTQAAASLAALPTGQARLLLAELAQAHLVAEDRPGRFAFHDLLRAYAGELAEQVDSGPDRQDAMRRVLGHYVHSANAADRLLDPFRDEPPALQELPAGVTPEQVKHALTWFDAEYRVLLALVQRAGQFDAEAWLLAWAMRRFFTHRGLWHHSLTALGLALVAARRLGDPVREAFAQCHIGCCHIWSGRYEHGGALLDQALDLYRKAGDRVGEADVLRLRCWMLERQDRRAEAMPHAQRALELYQRAGHQVGQGRLLNAIGWFHASLGDPAAGLAYCEKALDLQTKLGDKVGAAQTWGSLGHAHSRLGRHQRAIECYQASAELNHEFGYRYSEALMLSALGDAREQAGQQHAARLAWQAAFDLFDQIGLPDADAVRAKLR
jgi:DNA-binding SARP family transcriptional activator/tetratricopeptide (TPR) repeat protein